MSDESVEEYVQRTGRVVTLGNVSIRPIPEGETPDITDDD